MPVRSCVRAHCSGVTGGGAGGANGGGLSRPVPRSHARSRVNGGKRGRRGAYLSRGAQKGASLAPCARFWLRRVRGRKGGEGSRVIWGEERRCTRYALLTHMFPYLYFIYSTHIEVEKF